MDTMNGRTSRSAHSFCPGNTNHEPASPAHEVHEAKPRSGFAAGTKFTKGSKRSPVSVATRRMACCAGLVHGARDCHEAGLVHRCLVQPRVPRTTAKRIRRSQHRELVSLV